MYERTLVLLFSCPQRAVRVELGLQVDDVGEDRVAVDCHHAVHVDAVRAQALPRS